MIELRGAVPPSALFVERCERLSSAEPVRAVGARRMSPPSRRRRPGVAHRRPARASPWTRADHPADVRGDRGQPAAAGLHRLWRSGPGLFPASPGADRGLEVLQQAMETFAQTGLPIRQFTGFGSQSRDARRGRSGDHLGSGDRRRRSGRPSSSRPRQGRERACRAAQRSTPPAPRRRSPAIDPG